MSTNAIARTDRLASSYRDGRTRRHNSALTHCHNPALTYSPSNVNQRTTADADRPIQDEVSRQSH